MKQWIAVVKQAKDGEYYVELPQEMLDELGWTEGDELIYTIDKNEITLRKLQIT